MYDFVSTYGRYCELRPVVGVENLMKRCDATLRDVARHATVSAPITKSQQFSMKLSGLQKSRASEMMDDGTGGLGRSE